MKKSITGKSKQKIHSRNRLFAALLIMLLVIGATIFSLFGVQSSAEAECWQNLRSAAQAADTQLKDLLENTFANLGNTAEMIANLPEIDGNRAAEGVSGSRIGSMEMEMRLYLPDGRAFTAGGILSDVSANLDYTKTLNSLDANGRYISCVKKDFVDSEKTVMECFAPVKKNGQVVALVSAVMDTDALQNQIVSTAYNGGTRVYALDTRDGMMFLDNDHKAIYPLETMNSRVDKNGKSIQPYLDEAMARKETSTTVMSERYDEPALMFSIPSEANESWVVTIVVKESTAFAAEASVRTSIIAVGSTALVLAVLFLLWMLLSIRREKAEVEKANEAQRRIMIENSARLLALEDNIVSFYDVDLESGEYELQLKEQVEDHGINAQMVKGENFFEDTAKNVLAVVHPEDRDGLTEVLRPEFIKEALEKENHFDYYYRLLAGETAVWAKMRMVYKNAEKQRVIIGAFDAENDIEVKQLTEQKEALEETLAFMNYFLNTYVTAYYINLTTKDYKIYKGPVSTLGKSYLGGHDYLSALTAFFKISVHPDDLDGLIAQIQPDTLKEQLQQGDVTYNFRDMRDGNEKIIRMQVIKGPDDSHAAFGFRDVTEEYREQQKHLLGAVPISPDILAKESIGMWAFELDEGQPPRMYGDEAMLRLVGLDHQVAPEEMYHAWYDHIDEGSYGLVTDAVNKMSSGEHAEVQYPWHHPDGHTMIVRCGGVRNPEYTKGMRIEGTHQNVTEVLHYDEAEVQRLKSAAIQLQHEQLRSEVLNYMINNEDDPIELLKSYAEQLRVLIGCDQVIYRDLEETRIMVNSPAIEKTWAVPFEYCQQCEHLDAHHPMYAGGFTEMDNCQEGWQGIPVYEKCPIKSSLTRIVYQDGEIAGYLAIHYVVDYHRFTDLERRTVEEFTRILSISLSRFKARQENRELKLLQEYQKELQVNNEIISGLASEYLALYYVNMKDQFFKVYSVDGKLEDTKKLLSQDTDAFALIRKFAESPAVHPDDRALFANMTAEAIKKRLDGIKRFTIRFRRDYGQGYLWSVMDVVKYEPANEEANSIAIGFAERDKEIRAELEQQKQLQEAYNQLKEANETNKEVLGFVNGIKWTYTINDKDEVIGVSYDDAAYGKFELGQDDPLGWTDLVHPEDKARVLEEFGNAVKNRTEGKQVDFAYRLLGVDGKYQWSKVTGQTILHDDGTRELTGITLDVTEQMEKEREQQRQLQEQLALSDGLAREYHTVWLLESTGKHTMHLYRSTGKKTILDAVQMSLDNPSYDPIITQYVNTYIHEDDRERVLEATKFETIKRETPEDGTYVVTYRRYNPEHTAFDYHQVVYARAKAADGQEYFIYAFRDADKMMEEQIAQQKQLEEAFDKANDANMRNEALYRMMNASKWSYFIDADGNISSVNYSKRIHDHLDVEDPDPMAWLNLIHEEDRERVKGQFLAAINDRTGKTPYDTTYRAVVKDGSVQWIKTTGRLISHTDGTAELFGMSLNITEQIEQEREQQKRLAEALSMAESANRAKTTFLNNMSHDIRTPMNAIIGYTGLAASHIDHKEQVQDYLGKIAQSSDHLLSLINDVLDMSRIESGKMNLEEKPENLSDIIHTLRDIIQADIHSKQLDLFVDAVDVNDEDVICDKLRLNQVLLNVLSNAIKYTAAGGTVSLRVRERSVKKNGYGTYEFKVKDNGMGMDKAFLATIFDPFTRVKSSTVSGIQGTGLGMAITKNIIDMMGGKIDIESEPGRGTEVTMTFDFKLQSTPKIPEAIPELEGVRALVADDDSNTCLSICNMVKDVGMRFEWCTSGKEAVIRAEAAHRGGDSFKVFIIDWIMPDMNGIETTRRIRKVIGDDIPIIILTAYDWSDIEEEARDAGVTAFVSKPMFPSDLHRVLNKCLGHAEEPEEKPVETFDFTGRKVLIVEDNELNREIAQEVLTENGFITDCAEDGDIAVEKIKAAKVGDYDLILMDIQMPRLNGYDATREIRALGTEISKIPIIAMTANAFEEDKKLALEAGMNEHIAKPIDIKNAFKIIAKFLK